MRTTGLWPAFLTALIMSPLIIMIYIDQNDLWIKMIDMRQCVFVASCTARVLLVGRAHEEKGRDGPPL
jgi:hypothetical protein